MNSQGFETHPNMVPIVFEGHVDIANHQKQPNMHTEWKHAYHRDLEQTADILTKPLPKPKHQRHRREMGMGAAK